MYFIIIAHLHYWIYLYKNIIFHDTRKYRICLFITCTFINMGRRWWFFRSIFFLNAKTGDVEHTGLGKYIGRRNKSTFPLCFLYHAVSITKQKVPQIYVHFMINSPDTKHLIYRYPKTRYGRSEKPKQGTMLTVVHWVTGWKM